MTYNIYLHHQTFQKLRMNLVLRVKLWPNLRSCFTTLPNMGKIFLVETFTFRISWTFPKLYNFTLDIHILAQNMQQMMLNSTWMKHSSILIQNSVWTKCRSRMHLYGILYFPSTKANVNCFQLIINLYRPYNKK